MKEAIITPSNPEVGANGYNPIEDKITPQEAVEKINEITSNSDITLGATVNVMNAIIRIENGQIIVVSGDIVASPAIGTSK